MASIISSDPMRARWDTIRVIAAFDEVLEIKWIWWEHCIIVAPYGYHHFTACLLQIICNKIDVRKKTINLSKLINFYIAIINSV